MVSVLNVVLIFVPLKTVKPRQERYVLVVYIFYLVVALTGIFILKIYLKKIRNYNKQDLLFNCN